MIGIAIVLAFVASPLAQDTRNANQLLQAAQTKEAIQNDLTGAIVLYEQAVKAAGADRAMAPRTLLALARAYEKAGRDEARQTYQRIVAEYADSGSAVTAARTRLAALGQASGGAFQERNLDARIQDGELFHTISPDGRSVAYLSRRRGLKVGPAALIQTLSVRDLATGRERAVAEPKSADEVVFEAFYWSPDSQHLAYMSALERRVLTISNGRVRAFGDLAKTRNFRAIWSPDSQLVAMGTRPDAAAPWEYHVGDLATGAMSSLGSTLTTAAAVLWSPDSSKVALARGSVPEIVVMTHVGQPVRTISIPAATAGMAVSPLQWTSDNRIFFSRPVDGGNDWYAVDATAGSPTKICEGRGRSGGDGCADISPDGRLQVTRKNVSGGGRIALRSTKDGSERFLTQQAVVEESYGFSTDGQLFAFRSNRDGPWGIYVVAVDQIPAAHPARIAQLESAETLVVAVWTSRGLALRMHNSQSHLYRVDLDPSGRPTGVPVRLTKDGTRNGQAYVSPDNRWLAYVTGPLGTNPGASLTVAEANGAAPRVIAELVRGSELLGWRSATEVLMAVSATPGVLPPTEWRFRTLNPATGETRDVPGKPVKFCRPYQYVAATDELFCYAPKNAGVDIYALNGSASRRVDLPQGFYDFTVGYNGRLIAYSSGEWGNGGRNVPVPGDTRLRNLDGGADRVLVKYADSDDGSHMTYEFSRDGRFLIYQTPSMEMRILEVQNPTNSWPLSPSLDFRVDAGEPSWSPDGRFVVVETPLRRIALRLFEGITPATVKGK
jgi:Tol biopolymer transport system component